MGWKKAGNRLLIPRVILFTVFSVRTQDTEHFPFLLKLRLRLRLRLGLVPSFRSVVPK